MASSNSANEVGVLLGNGDGTFAAPLTVASGSHRFAIADLDGDGHLDVAVPDNQSDTLHVHLGDGTGALAAADVYPTRPAPHDIIAADVDNSGMDDLIVICSADSTAKDVQRGFHGDPRAPRKASHQTTVGSGGRPAGTLRRKTPRAGR